MILSQPSAKPRSELPFAVRGCYHRAPLGGLTIWLENQPGLTMSHESLGRIERIAPRRAFDLQVGDLLVLAIRQHGTLCGVGLFEVEDDPIPLLPHTLFNLVLHLEHTPLPLPPKSRSAPTPATDRLTRLFASTHGKRYSAATTRALKQMRWVVEETLERNDDTLSRQMVRLLTDLLQSEETQAACIAAVCGV